MGSIASWARDQEREEEAKAAEANRQAFVKAGAEQVESLTKARLPIAPDQCGRALSLYRTKLDEARLWLQEAVRQAGG